MRGIIGIIVFVILFVSVSQASAGIITKISDVSVESGRSVIVPIKILNVSDTDPSGLGSATIKLVYNPSVVIVSDVTKPPGSFDSISPNINNTRGEVVIVGYQTGANGVTGNDVTFVNVNLTAMGVQGAYSTLDLVVVDMFNNNGIPLTSLVVNGTFTVTVIGGPGFINGTVTNVSSGLPISSATVTAGGLTAITNPTGFYSINIAPGTYTVTASAVNFASQSVPGVVVVSGATTIQNFLLQPGLSPLVAPFDTNGDGIIQKNEAQAAVVQYFTAVPAPIPRSTAVAVLLSYFSAAPSGGSPGAVTRAFSATNIVPGGTLTVTLTPTADVAGTLGWQAVETLPAGFAFVSHTADGMTQSGNVITFTKIGAGAITYNVTASNTQGTYTFVGNFRDQNNAIGIVTGASQVTVVVQPIVTAVPNIISVGIPTTVTITVTQGGLPVSGATVTLTGAVLPAPLSDTTDPAGIAIFSVNATASGTITVTATSPAFITPAVTTITASGSGLPPEVAPFDLNGNGIIDRYEAVNAVVRFFSGDVLVPRSTAVAVVVAFYTPPAFAKQLANIAIAEIANGTINRSFSASNVAPGGTLTVTMTPGIDANGSTVGMFYLVNETLPAGAIFVSSNADYVAQSGQVVTFIMLGSSPFTYSVVVPNVVGTLTFNGVFRDDYGTYGTVTGASQVAVAPQLYVSISESPDPVNSGGTSQVNVHVNTIGGVPVSDTNVIVSATGGTLNPISGATDNSGNFASTYTAPILTSSANIDMAGGIVSAPVTDTPVSTVSGFWHELAGYDFNSNSVIEKSEKIQAVQDYFNGKVAKQGIDANVESAGAANGTVTRSFSASTVAPNGTLTVAMTPGPDANGRTVGMFYLVNETLPPGVTFVSSNADYVNQSAQFVTFIMLGSSPFTYTVRVPDIEGTLTFSGIFKDDWATVGDVIGANQVTVTNSMMYTICASATKVGFTPNSSCDTITVNPATNINNLISIPDILATPGSVQRVPITIYNSTGIAAVGLRLCYNASVVLAYSDPILDKGDFTDFYGPDNSQNTSGCININAYKTLTGSNKPLALTGNPIVGYVRLRAVGNIGDSSPLNLSDITLTDDLGNDVQYAVRNGTFTIISPIPPSVTHPGASHEIPDDTDNEPLWGETAQLNVTVTDDEGIASVTVNLSEIGGAASKQMVSIGGNIWSTTTNASAGTLPKLYNLTVNATDIFGNSNTSVRIQLRVMKNGDTTGNGVVNIGDALRLANNVSFPGNPIFALSSPYVADVTGNGVINIGDALRLANNVSYPGNPLFILR